MNTNKLYRKNMGSLYKLKIISLAVICAIYTNECYAYNNEALNMFCEDKNSNICSFHKSAFEEQKYEYNEKNIVFYEKRYYDDFYNYDILKYDKQVNGSYLYFDGNRDNKYPNRRPVLISSYFDNFATENKLLESGNIEKVNYLNFSAMHIHSDKNVNFNAIEFKNLQSEGGGGNREFHIIYIVPIIHIST